MPEITYPSIFIAISILWILLRSAIAILTKSLSWRRELQLPLLERVSDVDELILLFVSAK